MRLLPLLLLLATAPVLADEPAVPPPTAPPPAGAAPAVPPPVEPAATPAVSPPAAQAISPAVPPGERPAPLPKLGLRLATGFPEGATFSVVYRPIRDVRIEAGPAWNYLGWGAQVGVGFQPFHGAVSPVLDLGYGHYFESDASARFPSAPSEMQPLIQHLAYDYLAGLISLEVGSGRGFSFSIGGGISYFWTTIKQSVTVTQNAGTLTETQVTFDHPSFRAVLPTLKFGVLYYF